jgi:hypothetical protein
MTDTNMTDTESMDLKIKKLQTEVKNLEIKNLMLKQGTCEWITHGKKNCTKSNNLEIHNGYKFCNTHKKNVMNYQVYVKDDEERRCGTFENIKLIPRSFAHVDYFMKSVNNGRDDYDTVVDICLSKGCIEEGDISNKNYISMTSDDCHFFYEPERGQDKSKSLRILLSKYCKNDCKIIFNDENYCGECYDKLKNVPKFSLLEVKKL